MSGEARPAVRRDPAHGVVAGVVRGLRGPAGGSIRC